MDNKPDIYGRIWMHCESGLALNKASMSRFIMFVLENNIKIGSLYAFNPRYKNSLVLATVCLKPDQIEQFEKETKAKLRQPPEVNLN